tara:strand:+ start:2927 stop:3553 length:627 start_codon:yes stop_codon:yes gene_type:complete
MARTPDCDLGNKDVLYDLPLDELFVVEGTSSKIYDLRDKSGNRIHNATRFALEDVFIYEYDTSKRFDREALVGHCGHVNIFRKSDNINFERLLPGETSIWIGKVFEYNDSKGRGMRRSLKLFVDSNISGTIKKIEARMRALSNEWETTSDPDKEIRLQGTEKRLDRFVNVLENYHFIPWISKPEGFDRVRQVTEMIHSVRRLIHSPQA